jgi:RNA polymerase sigma-70 factor (ECF subfamily)
MGLNSSIQLTDEDVVRLVQSGNIEIFGEIVNRYEEKIKRYGRKFLSGTEDIEDIVQDTFIKAYENIQDFDANRKLSSWLYRIAHNEFINALKKQKKKPLSIFELDTILPYHFDKEIQQEMDKDEVVKALDKCLDDLDLKYREPVILYYLEGLDYREIAEVLRIPISTVGIRLKRGRDKIKLICNKLINKKYE